MQYSAARESQSVAEWARAVGPLVQTARELPVEGLGSFVGTWAKSVSYLGEAELHARRAERAEVFGRAQARRADASERHSKLEQTGRDGLRRSRKLVLELRKDLDAYGRRLVREGRDLGAELDEHREMLFDELAEMELKRADAEQLRDLVDDAVQRTKRDGLGALADWMGDQLDRGVRAREQPDRGASTNFAPWKLVAVIGILVALGIAFWIHCGWFSCDVYSRNNYIAAILTVAGLWWC